MRATAKTPTRRLPCRLTRRTTTTAHRSAAWRCSAGSSTRRTRRPTRKLGAVKPSYPIGVELGEAAACLPDFAQTMLRDSLPYFGRKIRGYDTADALLTGPETRTSSPVRMTRGEDLFGLGCSGIIPCGEGAGYAGGIMSAAVDGIRAAFRIMEEFLPE